MKGIDVTSDKISIELMYNMQTNVWKNENCDIFAHFQIPSLIHIFVMDIDKNLIGKQLFKKINFYCQVY